LEDSIDRLTDKDIGVLFEIDELRGRGEQLRRFVSLYQGFISSGKKVSLMAGSHKRSASLSSYREQFSPACSIRLSTLNFGLANNIRSAPLYAAFCLAQL
jgi:hypothetical protein